MSKFCDSDESDAVVDVLRVATKVVTTFSLV